MLSFQTTHFVADHKDTQSSRLCNFVGKQSGEGIAEKIKWNSSYKIALLLVTLSVPPHKLTIADTPN